MKNFLSLLAALALAAPAAAVAEGGGYVGLGLGQNTMQDWNGGDLNIDGSVSNTDADDSDTGFRILGGYEFNPNIAVEVGYIDLGEATADGTSDGSGFFWAPGPVSVSAEVDGFDLGIRGRLPLSESFGLSASIGMLMWDLSASLSDSSGTFSGSDDGNDVFFAAGADFRFGPGLGLRGEFARYALDDIDMDSLSIALVYHFNLGGR